MQACKWLEVHAVSTPLPSYRLGAVAGARIMVEVARLIRDSETWNGLGFVGIIQIPVLRAVVVVVQIPENLLD